jgi:CheY-like chemotaxis protein
MKKILIVDDYKEIRSLVTATLGSEVYSIFEADNAAEALQIVSSEKPELVIMDVNMPGGMDGIKALKILKSNKDTIKCRVIMLSGAKDSDIQEKAFEAGADGYLPKPFSPLELIEKVEKALSAQEKKKRISRIIPASAGKSV